MRIVILIREPFLDKIPNLKTLIWNLAQAGNEILIISSKDDKYPAPSFTHPLIDLILLSERSKFLELPTVVKLAWQFIKVYFKREFKICIGGDTYGNILVSFLKKFLKIKHVFFMLEYPQILTPTHQKLSSLEKQEIKGLKKANLIITHDSYHSKFLIEKFKINPKKISLLPNSTFTKNTINSPHFLHDKLGLAYDNNIVLHCGGMGIWFKCKEVAKSTFSWPEKNVLVFHTSHKVENDSYYKEISSLNYNNKVYFSTIPVSTEELDSLIGSATIGIATYSREILGYRADLLGLAAGKVGNYLKCGLPVIATNLSSFSFIEEYKCGILIENESEIRDSILQISLQYLEYSNNARKCYEEIWESTKYVEKIKIHFDELNS